MADNKLLIRPLATIEEFLQVEELQRLAWNMQDSAEVVPLHVTLTAQKNGGLVAGAFDGQDSAANMLGFVFGFVGIDGDGRFKHCSHMMGIRPEAKRQNVGYRLKLFQRQYVLKQGLDLVTWTFDPLEGVNASLNIAKLGAICHKYHHNLYGYSLGGLNRSLPTDRFEVEWWVGSPRVRSFVDSETPRERPTAAQLKADGAVSIIDIERKADIPHCVSAQLNATANTLVAEIPADFQAVKASSIEAASVWRRQTALVFNSYFANGYTITDFLSETDGAQRRNYYVLSAHHA